MNESRIHRNMKIARDDSTVKLGCSDWCGLPLNALKRISEQALMFFHSKGGRCSYWGLLHWNDQWSPWLANRDGPQHDRSRSDTVISVWIRNKIFWSGFFSSVIKLAHVFQENIIKALTSEIIVAGLVALKDAGSLERLVCVPLKHHA